MTRQAPWRLALMFDAPGHDFAALESALRRSRDAIIAAAAGNPVRIGMADRHPDLDWLYDNSGGSGGRTVDGAIEVTFSENGAGAISTVCRALRPIMAELADIASVEVMAGPVYPMVPVRSGGTFLSLAFRRVPAITSRQFRDWWREQHAPMAIPVLGPGLLAYDQVHVEAAASQDASRAFGVPTTAYDAYDNLTWNDRQGFIASCSDLEGMERLNQDEIGHIENTSRRAALMYEVR